VYIAFPQSTKALIHTPNVLTAHLKSKALLVVRGDFCFFIEKGYRKWKIIDKELPGHLKMAFKYLIK